MDFSFDLVASSKPGYFVYLLMEQSAQRKWRSTSK